jgi:hypothetical protein
MINFNELPSMPNSLVILFVIFLQIKRVYINLNITTVGVNSKKNKLKSTK